MGSVCSSRFSCCVFLASSVGCGIYGFDVIGSWTPSTGLRMICWACWALGGGYTMPVFWLVVSL